MAHLDRAPSQPILSNLIGEHLPEIFLRALDAIHEGIYILDSTGRFIYANPAYTRILGVPTSRILGRKFADVEPEVGVLQILETRRPILGEYLYLKSIDKHVVADQTPILSQDGTLLGIISAFRNITELVELERALQNTQRKVLHLKEELRRKGDLPVSFQRIIGQNRQLHTALDVAYRAAKTDATVLITGESGVGKELVARAIHEHSPRRESHLVVVNCAALPDSLLESELFGYEEGAFTGARRGGKPGKFELADSGTLFLDEVGELPLAMQAKILRALQTKELQRVGGMTSRKVDVRFIAATNADLEARVKDGSFRLDLFHRLSVIPIRIPPLRERSEDVPLLAGAFLQRYAALHHRTVEFSREALKQLTDYSWPGNIRELENAIQYAIVMAAGSLITPADLPPKITSMAELPEENEKTISSKLTDVERKAILEAIKASHGNRSEAIRRLGISRATFYKKIKEYNVRLQ